VGPLHEPAQTIQVPMEGHNGLAAVPEVPKMRYKQVSALEGLGSGLYRMMKAQQRPSEEQVLASDVRLGTLCSRTEADEQACLRCSAE
jgi:hypothetical protein